MPLTQTQQGIIGQTEAAKLIVMGSDGEVEVAWPWTDDDHRDIEAHIRRSFSATMPIQVKTAWRFWTHRQSEVIQIPFSLPADRVLNDPSFWYIFAFMERAHMAFRDPLFLVPSTDVHERAQPRLTDGRWHFMFQASLKPGAGDRWSPYRVAAIDLGSRILAIMHNLEKRKRPALSSNRIWVPADSLWVGRARSRAA
jgi:hypothetical protein